MTELIAEDFLYMVIQSCNMILHLKSKIPDYLHI